MTVSRSQKSLLAAVFGILVLALAVVLAAIFDKSPTTGQRSQSSTVVLDRIVDANRNGASPRRITNEFGMEFVEIPAGHFVMGSTRGGENEQPHMVHITRPFFLGVTEVTGWELTEIGIASGKWRPESRVIRRRDRESSTSIASWREANRLANTLSNLDPDYQYRLPTEAEWEYACRGRVDSLEASKDDAEVSQPHHEEYGVIEPTRRHPPNAFGLYDMLRNNGEYCADWYSTDYYDCSPLKDPTGPQDGRGRVIRGLRSEGHDRSYSAWRRDYARPGGDGNILIGVRFVLEKMKRKNGKASGKRPAKPVRDGG